MIVGASDLGKYKTFTQYLAITLLILERNVPVGLEAEYAYLSRGMLWAALTLTVVSGLDYFVRFLRSSDIDALVKEDRWR
jgi:phosphatidylglycerophosphate synthase